MDTMDQYNDIARKVCPKHLGGYGGCVCSVVAIALRNLAAEKDAEIEKLKMENTKAYAARDEALTKWYEHQKVHPCEGCTGGHPSFWKTITDSDQWRAWEASSQRTFDTIECASCGHISRKHWKAFMEFVTRKPTVSSIYPDDERLFHDYYAASLSHPTDNSPQKTADEAVKEHRERFPRHKGGA